MFDKYLRIESGPDWHHFYVYTDSWFVAMLLVVALLLAIFLLLFRASDIFAALIVIWRCYHGWLSSFDWRLSEVGKD